MFRWLDRFRWWILHRTSERYDRIYIKSLKPGYHDKDEMMLHACFQLLVDFVDREKPFDLINWDHDERHREVSFEIKDLYDWWTNRRPLRKSALDRLPESKHPVALACWVTSESGHLSYGPNEAREEAFLYPEYVEATRTSTKEEESWELEDEENLIRLVKIRSYLWT